jgi:CelD/BcsL family acetyltransferase involved in cellulose biosynthesis
MGYRVCGYLWYAIVWNELRNKKRRQERQKLTRGVEEVGESTILLSVDETFTP